MSQKKEIVMSGIRPTGQLHLGNILGAVSNWVEMQEAYDCYFCIVDWHSLTTHPDTSELKSKVLTLLAGLLAVGLNPDKSVIYVQSQVPETSELYLYLNMLAYRGELEKTVAFKEKVRNQPENVNAGLLTYPVLQAADILIHRAVKVPVGKDQEQHLEMARNFVQRFNQRYGDTLQEPKAFSFGKELTKIMGLDGQGKMSKSVNQMSTIYMEDDDDLIRKKIMKAKTDSGPTEPNMPKPDYIENLFALLQIVSEPAVSKKFSDEYNQATIRYGDLKKQLAEDMVKFITPMRARAEAILHDQAYLNAVMEKGAEKARASARQTIQLVKEAMGLNYLQTGVVRTGN